MNRNKIIPSTGLTPVQTAMIFMPGTAKPPVGYVTELVKATDEYKAIVANNPSLRDKPAPLLELFTSKHPDILTEASIQAEVSWRLRMVDMMFDMTENNDDPQE